ncbi:hypothetical protein AB1L30_00325, partial [Bremerella sp. JC817]
DDSHIITVEEGGLKFEVNLSDYVDTGLFLDHRNLRSQFRDEASGKRASMWSRLCQLLPLGPGRRHRGRSYRCKRVPADVCQPRRSGEDRNASQT